MFIVIFTLLFSWAILSECSMLYNFTEVIERQKLFEKGGFFQGDMRLSKDQESRVGVIKPNMRWSRIVPFKFAYEWDSFHQQVVLDSLTVMEKVICIRFVERTNQRDYVYITKKKSGCWSHVGRIQKRQELNLETPGCIHEGVIIHEFMHALGFEHEHCAPNRDEYVIIHPENVRPEESYNFAKTSWDDFTMFNLSYDYLSIMHYSAYAFSGNGRRTITTRDPTMQNVIGQMDGMSRTDIRRINRMYNCPENLYQRRSMDTSSKMATIRLKHYLFINFISMLFRFL